MAGIKTLEMDPTRENVYNTLVVDAVGRNENLSQFACFCSAQEDRCSIALDGGWGTGKTFFLRQLQMLFDAYSDHPKHLTVDQQNAIKTVLDSYIKKYGMGTSIHPHTCIYYDAWLNDNSEDPMRSILHEIITETDTNKLFEKKGLWQKLYRPISSFFKKQSFSPSPLEALEALCKAADDINPLNLPETIFPYLKAGKAVLPFFEYMKKNNPVHEIDNQKRFHNAFEDYLDEAITDKNSRLLVLIDELDRCKPTYAVQLLERIKHYLSNDRITFVFSLNEKELQHTINAIYGDQFSGYRYLDRFFDVQFSFPSPNMSRFLMMLHLDDKDDNNYLYKSACETFIIVYSLSIRESIKYYQIVDFVCKSFQNDAKKSKDFSWKMVMYIIVPIAIGLRFLDGNKFSNFLKGQLHDPLLNVVLSSDILATYLTIPHLKRDKWENKIIEADMSSKDAGRLLTIYAVLLTKKLNNVDQKNLFPFTFTKEMLNAIYSASNMMADFIKFDTNTEETAHG